MRTKRREYRLADRQFKDVDLTKFSDIIINTINSIAPGKHPEVSEDHYTVDVLTQRETVMVGQALSKQDKLKPFFKELHQYRLFEGRDIKEEAISNHESRKNQKANAASAAKR